MKESNKMAKQAEVAPKDCLKAAYEVIGRIMENGSQPLKFPLWRCPHSSWLRISYYGDYHWLAKGHRYAYVARDLMMSDPFSPEKTHANWGDEDDSIPSEMQSTEVWRLPMDEDLTATMDALMVDARPNPLAAREEKELEVYRRARMMLKNGVLPQKAEEWLFERLGEIWSGSIKAAAK